MARSQRGAGNALKWEQDPWEAVTFPPPWLVLHQATHSRQISTAWEAFREKATYFIRGSGRINTQEKIKPVKSSAKLPFQSLLTQLQ